MTGIRKRQTSGSCLHVAWVIFIALGSLIAMSSIFRYLQVDDDPSSSLLAHASSSQLETQDEKTVVLPQGYDVLDIGTGKGGYSILFLSAAVKTHFAKKAPDTKTLGIDNDPAKVEGCNKKGYDCIQGNVLKIQTNKDSHVAGTTMWHVLEHMPTCGSAMEIWHKASTIATKFSSFRGPAFDDEDILQKAGFHRFYENWTGHHCHFDSNMLIDAIGTSPRKMVAYIVVLLKPFSTSKSPVVLPDGSKKNSHYYDQSIHPKKPKKAVEFSRPLYEEMRACAIYEPLNQLSLYSALALDDVLKDMKRFDGTILKCQFSTHVTGADVCQSALEKLIAVTIDEQKYMNKGG